MFSADICIQVFTLQYNALVYKFSHHLYNACLQFPTVVNPVFDAIDEVSKDAARILTGQPLPSKSASSSPLSLKKTSSATNNGDAASLMDVPFCNGNGQHPSNGSLEQLTNGIDSLKAGFTENGFENLQVSRVADHFLPIDLDFLVT